MQETKVVSRVVPMKSKYGQDSGNFLKELRNTVQEVRAENPELVGYHLFDLGFIQQEDGLEVKMYFAE